MRFICIGSSEVDEQNESMNGECLSFPHISNALRLSAYNFLFQTMIDKANG